MSYCRACAERDVVCVICKLCSLCNSSYGYDSNGKMYCSDCYETLYFSNQWPSGVTWSLSDEKE